MATASGWETLGSVLGGGTDRQGAYNEGRLRTAQTAGALELARNRQLENIGLDAKNKAQAKMEEALVGTGMDPAQARMYATGMQAEYGNFQQMTEGGLNLQEQGFRGTLGDPAADPRAQFAAGQGVQGKALNPYDMVGQAEYADLRAPDAGLATTALGDSLIDENAAAAELSRKKAGDPDLVTVGTNTTPGGVKAPSAFEPNPAYDPTLPDGPDNAKLRPISGGPSDPNAPAAAGSRESVFNERMFLSAAQTIPDVKNLMLLPSTANTGIMGIGARPGPSIVQSSVDALRNTIAEDAVRTFERQAGQLARGMAWMESNGLAPSEAVINSYREAYTLRPGDTGFDAMLVYSNIRQTVEQMARVKLANPRIPQAMKAELTRLRDELRAAVPFMPEDVLKLQYGGGRYHTMADVVNEKGLGATPPAAAPPAAAPPAAAPPAAAPPAVERWERGPDGKLRRVSSPGTP